MERIDYGTFYECGGLTKIEISSSMTSIEFNTFDGCKNITIRCPKDYNTHQYAVDNHIPYEFMKGMSIS